jgi:thioredoxin-related protein
LILSLAFSSNSSIPEKMEFTFINDAVKNAKTANKLLIIEFWDPECISSIRLKEEIFENEDTREYLKDNFLLVKVSPSDSVYTSLYKHFSLNHKNSCVFMDINGNEIDRSVSYDGNRDAYLIFLKDVAEGRNLYCQVFMAYKKDTTDVRNNYLFAKKLLFRYQFKEAVRHFNKVLLLDPDNNKGFNNECKLKITESENLGKFKS